MNSKFFGCSKQRAMHVAQQVMRDMKCRITDLEKPESRIYAERSWRFLSTPQKVEVTVFTHNERIEIVTNVHARFPFLDFGSSEWLEEELLDRVADKLAHNE
jgi:hypothetical protein